MTQSVTPRERAKNKVYAGLFFVLFGVTWVGVTADEREYESVGVVVPGVVVSRRIDNGRTRFGHFKVKYRFTTATGDQVEKERSVEEKYFDTVRRGDVVQVQYPAGAPERSRLAVEATSSVTTRRVALGLFLAAAILVGMGTIELVSLARRSRGVDAA